MKFIETNLSIRYFDNRCYNFVKVIFIYGDIIKINVYQKSIKYTRHNFILRSRNMVMLSMMLSYAMKINVLFQRES